MVLVLVLMATLAAPAARARHRAEDPGAASFPGPPAYATLFERGKQLIRQGDWAGGLRRFSRIYGEEVPVDAFYRTLERRILGVIAGLDDEAGFVLGQESYQVGDLALLFQRVLLPQPEIHYSRLDLGRELPLARFLYLCVVAGRPHPRPPSSSVLQYALPRLDLVRALASPDPWLVSAALFMARKGLGRLRARQVMQRWQARPDLWDQVCTDQALLFLAGRPRAELEGLKPGDAMLGRELLRLRALDPRKAAGVRVWLCWAGSLDPASAHYLRRPDCAGLKVSDATRPQRRLSPACSAGFLRLAPGKYHVEYVSSRARGRSMAFPCRPGLVVRVVVPVLGHV